jgi:hypothetical protein
VNPHETKEPQGRAVRCRGRRRGLPGSRACPGLVRLASVASRRVARMIGRHQQMRRSRTTPLRSLHHNLHRYVVGRTGRQHPGRRPIGLGRTLLSGQADPSIARTEADTSRKRHPSPGVRSLWSQASVQSSSLTRAVTHAGDRNTTPGSLSTASDHGPPTKGVIAPRRRLGRPLSGFAGARRAIAKATNHTSCPSWAAASPTIHSPASGCRERLIERPEERRSSDRDSA